MFSPCGGNELGHLRRKRNSDNTEARHDIFTQACWVKDVFWVSRTFCNGNVHRVHRSVRAPERKLHQVTYLLAEQDDGHLLRLLNLLSVHRDNYITGLKPCTVCGRAGSNIFQNDSRCIGQAKASSQCGRDGRSTDSKSTTSNMSN